MKDEILEYVNRFKNDESLLIWGLGNEGELDRGDMSMDTYFAKLDELAGFVKLADPNHLTTTVVADLWDEKIDAMNNHSRNMDLWGINTYTGAPWLYDKIRRLTKPYAVTEFGPIGHSDVQEKIHDHPIEPSSTKKAEHYKESYEKAILQAKGSYCVGSYAFLWSHKFEGTPTWYGMFLSDQSRLAAVETISILWNNGSFPQNENHVPTIGNLTVNKYENIAINETITASCTASDPENDTLTWEWVLIDWPSNEQYVTYSHSITGQGNSVQVKLPKKGDYLLYAYVRDTHSNAAFVNQIFVCSENPLAETSSSSYSIELVSANTKASEGMEGWKIGVIVTVVLVVVIGAGIGVYFFFSRNQQQNDEFVNDV